MMEQAISLYDVHYVHRIVIGNYNPEVQPDENKYKEQLKELNQCLSSVPKGKIIGQEKNFFILNIGEHQIVMQYMVYHIGFQYKPYWLK